MKKDSKFEQFIGSYSLARTLKVQLEPQGDTRERLTEDLVMERDQKLCSKSQITKTVCDRYYSNIINAGLASMPNFAPTIKAFTTALRKYADLYMNNAEEDDTTATKREKEMGELQKTMRKTIASCICDIGGGKETLTKADAVIRDKAPAYAETDEEAEAVEYCAGKPQSLFARYFTNRKLLFDDQEKFGAVGYRTINENLPTFIENCMALDIILDKLPEAAIVELNRTVGSVANTLVEDMMLPESFIHFMTQQGIDAYNMVIGGYNIDKNTHVQGVNEKVNLYNQTLNKGEKKLPKLQALKKQILTDHEGFSFRYFAVKTDSDCAEIVKKAHKAIDDNREALAELFSDIATGAGGYDLDGIYLSDTRISALSKRMFGDWGVIKTARSARYDVIRGRDSVKPNRLNSFDDKKAKYFNRYPFASVEELVDCLNYLPDTVSKVAKTGADFTAEALKELQEQDLLEQAAYSRIGNLLAELEASQERNLINSSGKKFELKEYLDTAVDYMRIAKNYSCPKKANNKDITFYGTYEPLVFGVSEIQEVYDKVRNYTTQKPYSLEQMALTLECGTLMGGWDANKIAANRAVILRKDNNLYLGITTYGYDAIEKIPKAKDGEDAYEMMVMHSIDAGKVSLAMPKVLLLNTRKEPGWTKEFVEAGVPEDIMRIYRSHSYRKPAETDAEPTPFSIEDMHKLIDYYKLCLEKGYTGWFHYKPFRFSPTETYKSITDFFAEFAECSYCMNYVPVSYNGVMDFVSSGKLYLFRMAGKDLNGKSKGTENIFTMLLRYLFSDENAQSQIIRIKGGAQFFYREPSIKMENATVHRKGETIMNKNDTYYHKEHLCHYDIIKDRRHTVEQFSLTLPIVLNGKLAKKTDSLNYQAMDAIRNCEKNYIIGLSRGLRHLLYATVIDEDGNIVEQRSLNEIGGVDYKALLDTRSQTRDIQRKSWDEISGIKNIKDGYSSQAVRVVADLMVKYDALLVMEALDKTFKDKSMSMESNVFQNFETSMMKKLMFLFDKKADIHAPGGMLKAYQLTDSQDCKKANKFQSGFVFFVAPGRTVAIDPATGFTNLFGGAGDKDLLRFFNIDTAKRFFAKFDDIRYNKKGDYFEFSFRYSNFGITIDPRDEWTVVTQGERFKGVRNDNGSWKNITFNPTTELKELFEKHDLDYTKNIKEQILENNSREFFTKLYECLSMTLNIRNSRGVDLDIISSPVFDANGNRFVSGISDGPCCASANRAYNLARKGAMIVKRIKASEPGEFVSVGVKTEDWLAFAQGMPNN